MSLQITDLNKLFTQDLPRQLRYAAFLTAKELAYEIKKQTDVAIATTFDRPTPWTKRAIAVAEPNYDRVSFGADEIDAWVGLKHSELANPKVKGVTYDDAWMRALVHQFTGGPRALKQFEKALQRNKRMPEGWIAVPTENAPTDSYGNVKLGFIKQLLSYFDLNRDVGVTSNMRAKGRKKFNAKWAKQAGYGMANLKSEFIISWGRGARPGNAWKSRAERIYQLPAGIWERVYNADHGSSVRCLFFFIPMVGYRRRIFMDQIAGRVMAEKGPTVFQTKLGFAFRTMKNG